MTYEDLTVLIVARNAEKTIQRAINSALEARAKSIVVLDDASEDSTVDQCGCCIPTSVKIIPKPVHTTLGEARQLAMASVKTPYTMMLDADDELLPNRISNCLGAFGAGCDIYLDGAEFWDLSGKKNSRVIPDFLKTSSVFRLFERNYFPVLGPLGIRTELGLDIGYDPVFETAEDYDFMLRALQNKGRIFLDERIGYRVHETEGSVSKDITRQRQFVRSALKKHNYDSVERNLAKEILDKRIVYWVLCSMAIFRSEYSVAEEYLEQACPVDLDPNEVLEPDGPYPIAEGWRYAFTKGTLRLLQGFEYEAVEQFEHAMRWGNSADILNNLGVAKIKTGNVKAGKECFEKALEVFPGYHDATLNLHTESSSRITTHPLRNPSTSVTYGD